MEKKQTTVEFLMDKLFDPSQNVKEQLEWFEQAKAMHKEEVIKANRDGVDMVIAEEKYITGEQYYNETFGGEL